MSKKLLVFWAYIVEIISSTFVVILAFSIFDFSEVIKFVRASSNDVASNFAVVMLAASLGLFWTFYSKSDSPFVQWLHEKEAFEVYAHSFFFSVGVYVILVVSLILVMNTSSNLIAILSLWLSVLGLINVYSLIKNTYDLMKLNALFNRNNKEP
ncbi:hypothetical protein AAG584_16900 [Vreelandella titanicae]|uniref:hypothetical protein n=1 Tax=Halomonadaceae TaxID=28256 RepID=UPI00047FFBBC|nr:MULTISPECIES: hypothetical protein [unclassified Halomonas]NAO96041.1 hypothetical protein [Halomonas sp. MG34]PKH60255.1 hypothetical protein CXF94_15935 [Halomonas sp. Choline-3u-9]QGQ69401.1 hypothetical protein FDY98_03350 [Halomonas sp. PA16-9]